MTDSTIENNRRALPWRKLGWGGAIALLVLPFVAMQFTREVDWSASGFIFMGALFLVIGGAIELMVRQSGNLAYRAGAAIAIFGTFFLIWVNLAVGIIGDEQNDANTMFAAVIAIIVGGFTIAHMKPRGMGLTMIVAAAAQLLIGGIAVTGDLGVGEPAWPMDVIGLTLFLTGAWLVSAALLRNAAGKPVRHD